MHSPMCFDSGSNGIPQVTEHHAVERASERGQGDGVLAALARIQPSRRNHVEFPLRQIKWVEGGLVLVCEEREHIDVGIA